ncbi:MAG: polysaccharide biosynthesis/export family protein [Candidatus Thermoplasmatota archaeon]
MIETRTFRACVWCVFALAGATVVGAGCYGLTRPKYDQEALYDYPSDNNPPNIAKIVARYPELKGLVLTAPEYNAEVEQEAARREKEGVPAVSAYTIQPGVVLYIEVLGEAEFTRQVTVNVDGTFDYPLLGTLVVRGLTLQQVKDLLREKLQKYLRDPQIVLNATYANVLGGSGLIAAGKVLVLGRIGSPGPKNYTGQEKLSGMLALAGWFDENSERREVRVLKPRKGHRRARVVIADFQQFLVNADMAQDIPVEIDDIIYVPEHWTAGDQFSKDWDLTIRYLSGAQDLDGLLQYWGSRVNGRITGK